MEETNLDQTNIQPDLEENPAEIDYEDDSYIDMVLNQRQKKISVLLPANVPFIDGKKMLRLRKYLMENAADHQHLFGQVDGSTYGRIERPEIEMHLITTQKITEKSRVLEKKLEYGRRDTGDKKEEVEESQEEKFEETSPATNEEEHVNEENGIDPQKAVEQKIYADPLHIMFDTSKKIYILSQLDQDLLLLRLHRIIERKSMEELVLTSSILGFRLDEEDVTYQTVNYHKQRVWRRFVREMLLPELNKKNQIKKARIRVNEIFDPDANADLDILNTKSKRKDKGKRQQKVKGKGVIMGARK